MLRAVSHLKWLAGVQRDLLSAAWRGRHSPAVRANFFRLSHELWPYTPANTLPVCALEELFPGIRCNVRLRAAAFDSEHRYYRFYTHHACVLAGLVTHLRPRRILEFGTFTGEMAVNLALNAGPDCEIFTLDLPPGREDTRLPASANDQGMIRRRDRGDKFHELPSGAGRITQLLADSAEFDGQPYAGSFDFIYVDGAHSYEYCANDSRLAFQMLRPGGIIVWDDYNWSWPGVVKYLQEEARRRPIYQLEGTLLALYRSESEER